ncbi:hypothetical protein BC831DRAFT_511872 [Entophlyctis helioformis]|nr:hypothetical protein BC831DRAFT_511872 [Entophlyctis helioformis]
MQEGLGSIPESGNAPKTLRETIEDYTHSSNILKEIHMIKQPLWDFQGVTKAVEYCVRATGFPNKITIAFPTTNNKVSAFSSHPLSRMAQSCWTWCLLAVTCLWIIFLPLFYIVRKKVKTTIVSEYPVLISGPDFYTRNYYMIQGHVLSRSFTTVDAL